MEWDRKGRKRVNRKQFILLVGVILAVSATLVGCDGSNVASIISVSPTSVDLAPGGKQKFDAVIRNSGNPNNVSFSTDLGSIDQNGLYTAPQDLSKGSTAIVTVTARDNTAAPATAKVNLASVIAIAQGNQSVSVGRRTIQFTAQIDGKPAQAGAVVWSRSDPTAASAAAAKGFIDAASGIYTSPAAAPNNSTDIITATAGTINASVTVTVQSANVNIPVQ